MSDEADEPEKIALKPSKIRKRLRREYPALPAHVSEKLIASWAGHHFEIKALNRLSHMIVAAYVRHEQTDYEILLNVHKMTKKEARFCVNDEVQDLMKTYSFGPPPPRIDEGYVTMTKNIQDSIGSKKYAWLRAISRFFDPLLSKLVSSRSMMK